MASPMYRQIAEGLRDEIESGVLEPGQQLPTESDLQDRYSASRNTVREAIRMLMSLGLVETRPGQGTFVTKKMDPFVTTLVADPRTGDSDTYNFQVSEQKRKPSLSEVQLEMQKADAQLAARLGVREGSRVITGTKSASSMTRHGLCRPRSIRGAWPNKEPNSSPTTTISRAAP